MDKATADKLLNQTRDNYNGFAESFSKTRDYIWPEIELLLEGYVKASDKVLDIGCGNGRFYPVFKKCRAKYVGVDNSQNLIAIAKKNFPETEFFVADALALPFGDNEFDLAVSIAVLHHIPSNDLRLKFFQESRRILKPGGYLIATVWDLRPISMIKMKQWKRLKSFLKSQAKIALGHKLLDLGDFYIPWQKNYQRYHHSFSLRELKKLAQTAGFKVEKLGIANVGIKEANLYIVAKKRQN